MSRVARKPIPIPAGVEIDIAGQAVTAKGKRGSMTLDLHPTVQVVQEQNELRVSPSSPSANHRALAGTMRALLNNLVLGVSQGFERRLQLVGVGYRAQLQGNVLNLSLGYSHPINFTLPAGVTAEMQGQTDIILRGTDKQQVGQVAAVVRAFRPPEPYKGKGVRYSDEVIILKEAKKK